MNIEKKFTEILDDAERQLLAMRNEGSIVVRRQAREALETLRAQKLPIILASGRITPARKDLEDGLTALISFLKGPVLNAVPQQEKPLANDAAKLIESHQKILLDGLTATSPVANGYRAVSKSLGRAFEELSSLSELPDEAKTVSKFFASLTDAGYVGVVPDILKKESLRVYSDLSGELAVLALALPTGELRAQMNGNTAAMRNLVSFVSRRKIESIMARLEKNTKALSKINSDLKKEAERIEKIQAAGERCVATVKLVGSALKFLAVI